MFAPDGGRVGSCSKELRGSFALDVRHDLRGRQQPAHRFEWETDHVAGAAHDLGDEDATHALQCVGAGLAVGFAGAEVPLDVGVGERGDPHRGGLAVGRDHDLAADEAEQRHAGVHEVGPAGELAQRYFDPERHAARRGEEEASTRGGAGPVDIEARRLEASAVQFVVTLWRTGRPSIRALPGSGSDTDLEQLELGRSRDRRDVATCRTHGDGPVDQVVVAKGAREAAPTLQLDLEGLGLQARLRQVATLGQHQERLPERRRRHRRRVSYAHELNGPTGGTTLALGDELGDQ